MENKKVWNSFLLNNISKVPIYTLYLEEIKVKDIKNKNISKTKIIPSSFFNTRVLNIIRPYKPF